MDTLTHTVLGACIGEAIAGKKAGKKAMLIGAIANNIPDVDVLSNLWLKSPDSLLAHRGFTHSLLFLILFSPAIAYLLKKYSKINLSFREWLILIGSGMLIHIFIDAFTTYGTGWFEPFSHARVSFNTIFIIDPLFSIAPLVAAIALLVLKVKSKRRVIWSSIGVLIPALYLFYTVINKVHINSIAQKAFSKNNILVYNYFSTPAPLNNILWYIVAMDSAGAHIGYYSLFDKTDDVSFNYFPRNDSALVPLKDRPQVLKLIRFSQGFYTIENKKDVLIFNDLRFGQIGGWSDPKAPFVFSFDLFKQDAGESILQQGRMKASNSEALKTMLQRITGK